MTPTEPTRPTTSLLTASRQHLRELFACAGHGVTLAFSLMLACSLTEGIGLLLLIPMLQAVGLDVQQGALGRLAGVITAAFSTVGLRLSHVSVLALYVAVSAGQALLVRWQSITNEALGFRFAQQVRARLYRAIVGANWLFLSRLRSASLTHALTAEVDRTSAATYQLVSLAATIAITSVYVLLALKLSAATTLLVFGCGGALMWVVSRKNAATRQAGEGSSDTTRLVYGLAIEHLQSLKTTKSFAAEDRSATLFARGAAGMADAFVTTLRLHADAKAWFDIGSVLILALLVLVTLEWQHVPAAGVFLLLFLFARIMPRVSAIQQTAQHYVSLLPSLSAIDTLQRDCEAAAETPGPRAACAVPRRCIRFEDVSFRYSAKSSADCGLRPSDLRLRTSHSGLRTPEFALHALDLTIPVGTTTALVGQSGSGKSTIADLLLGLLTPDAGRILVDDEVLRAEMLASWRDQIGYVPQDTWLFHDTVRANLAWARPGATDADMHEAVQLAAADEIVAALPAGLDTIVGDRGVRLSGGERQRIALARALLRKPSLLVLDEATSAIDAENERRILDAIGRLHGELTILVITHRMASVRCADNIYVLEQGHLTEAGSWDTLTSVPGGRFRDACLAQGILLHDGPAVSGGVV